MTELVSIGPRLLVPAEAFEVVADLELRGIQLRAVGDELIARPSGSLTEEDCSKVRRWKLHVLAILDFVAEQERSRTGHGPAPLTGAGRAKGRAAHDR